MSRRSGDFEVDGIRYAVTQYSGTKGTEIFIKLVKAVGEPLSFMLKGVQGGLDAEVNMEMFGQAFRAFSMSADPKEFTFLVKDILDGVLIFDGEENRSIKYDLDFAGKIGHMFKVVWLVVKFQFADFLDVIAGLTPDVRASQTKFKAI